MGGNMGKNVVIAVSLLAAGFLAAWLRFRPYLGTEGAFTDGDRTIEIERIEELRYAVWDDPLPLEGELNSDESERAPAISPDGRYVVFVVGERGLGTDLWICDLDGRGIATDPRPLPGVNSVSDEVAPSFSAEGVLLFASNRPGGAGGLDIWRSRYDRGVFEAPERLGGNLNSPADDTDPAAVPWTGEVVFASARKREDESRQVGALRDHDLFIARPLPADAAGEPAWDVAPIDDVNSGFDERDPSLSADGRALLFASDRDGGAGGFDLYRSARAPADLEIEGAHVDWLPPRPLEGVNSVGTERDPRATADGFALLFSRRDVVVDDGVASEGSWDVWRAKSRELVRTPGRPIGWREILVLAALLLLALLAALAKRWRGLDVIYKAFLISLLIHLALLAWFREVVPESEPMPLREGDGTRVRVRLVDDPNSLSAQRNMERSGEVEAQRDVIEASASPEMSESAEQARAELAAPAPTAEVVLERGEAALANAPERARTAQADRTAEARPVEADLRASEESFERKTGAAPQLEVSARAVDASRAVAQATEVERSAASASEAQHALPVPVASAGAPLRRSRARDRSGEPAPARREVVVDRGETAAATEMGARALEMDAPATEFERLASDARTSTRPMEVAEASGASLDGRTQRDEAEAVSRSSAARTERREVSGEVAPATESMLTRGERADADAPAPTFVASAVGAPGRTPSKRGVDVAQPEAADVRAEVAEGAGAPAFDALADVDTEGGAIARTDVRPDLAAAAPAGTSRAEPGELRPSTLSPMGRSRPQDRPAPPAFTAPGAAPDVQRSDAVASNRSVDLAAPESPEPVARVAEASAAEASDAGSALELVPTEAGAPLRRSSPGASAPGLRAPRPAADHDRMGAPSPLEFDVAVATGPAPASGVAAPERARDQWDRTPYQSRSGDRKLAALEEFGGTEETERAVELGLEYLAGRQRSDGRWGRRENDEKYGQPLIGKTGLAVLAFMGAGHTQTSKTHYSEVVERGLFFLIGEQDDDTGHIGNCTSYGHAIATYALGEAYALTKDPRLRPALESAVQQILDNQVSSRDPLLDGGWRYFYRDGGRFDRWPRASVTAWQVMALESAKLGGVSVPSATFDRARRFLVNCWDPSSGSFRYSHDPSRLRSEYPTLPGSTPATMFALSLLGADLTSDQFGPARNFVLRRAPDGYRYTTDDDFVFRARGNLYFWYYGTLAMFRVGGTDWKRWNMRMKETLVPAQESDGSWEPISIYAEFAQDSNRDRVYTTAMNVLALEVYYRYFTPLLKVE